MASAETFLCGRVCRIHAEFQLNDVPDFPFWFTPGQFTGNIIISRDASHVRNFHLYVPGDRWSLSTQLVLMLLWAPEVPVWPGGFSPCPRSLNVDMEWLYGASESSNMEVDIGYLPQVQLQWCHSRFTSALYENLSVRFQLELQSRGPSTPSIIVDEKGNVIDRRDSNAEPIQFVFEEIHWASEISRQEAARRMEVTLYPFKKVNAHILQCFPMKQYIMSVISRRSPSQVSYLPFSEAFERAEAEKKLVHSILLWGALDDQSCWGESKNRHELVLLWLFSWLLMATSF